MAARPNQDSRRKMTPFDEQFQVEIRRRPVTS